MKRNSIILIMFSVLTTTFGQREKTAYFDILLSQEMIEAAHINHIDFIDNICVTDSRRIMLASKDSLYLFGYGGYATYKPKENRITLFTTIDDNTYYLNNNKLVKLNSDDGEKLILTLYFTPLMVWAEKNVIYASSIEKEKYGLWIVFPSELLQKRLLLLNHSPVGVFEHGGVLYVITPEELLLVVVKTGKYATIPFPQELISQVKSASIDHRREALYFSCDNGLFRFYNNVFQKVSNDKGTICYDQDGLLIFNAEKPSVIRLRNNFLYPEKEIMIELR